MNGIEKLKGRVDALAPKEQDEINAAAQMSDEEIERRAAAIPITLTRTSTAGTAHKHTAGTNMISQNWKFREVGSNLTKVITEPVKRLKNFVVSTGVYKETKTHQKTTTSCGTILRTISTGGGP